VGFSDGRFSLITENDVFWGNQVYGNNTDMYRTAALEAGYRLDNGMVLTTGFKLYTGNPGTTQKERDSNIIGKDGSYKPNKQGIYNPAKITNKDWKLGAAYGGIRYRGRQMQFGANSEAILDFIQNNFHRLFFIASPDFPWNVNAPTYGYYNYSSYNPYSLY
jgi:hypothetical protein